MPAAKSCELRVRGTSDAPGVVRLYDRTGRLLAQADVEMVQFVESVDWSNDKASIKLVVEWDLSRWPAAKAPPS